MVRIFRFYSRSGVEYNDCARGWEVECHPFHRRRNVDVSNLWSVWDTSPTHICGGEATSSTVMPTRFDTERFLQAA